jgi:hypothetical protein
LHAGVPGKCGGNRLECDHGPTILIGSALHDLGQCIVDHDDRGGQRRRLVIGAMPVR